MTFADATCLSVLWTFMPLTSRRLMLKPPSTKR
jgi:hypothetical protein